MNPNYKPEAEETFSADQIERGKAIIRAAITKNQQCFWPDIVAEGDGSLPAGVLLKASSEMQKAKELRLREDSYEHAMEYILRVEVEDFDSLELDAAIDKARGAGDE